MRPYIDRGAMLLDLGVTSKFGMPVQKGKSITIEPGYQISIQVLPQMIETSSDFPKLNLEDRKCKLMDETDNFQYYKTYARQNCINECAAKTAAEFCKCLPWNFPNNFTEVST